MPTCHGCDKELIGNQTKWCSDRCRRRAGRPKGHWHRCKHCDKKFWAKRRDAVYCTDRCRHASRRGSMLLALSYALAKNIDALCQTTRVLGLGGSKITEEDFGTIEEDEELVSLLWPNRGVDEG